MGPAPRRLTIKPTISSRWSRNGRWPRIYKGMFEFMMLQCIAIVLVVAFPWIATSFPEQLRRHQGGTDRRQQEPPRGDRFEQF